MALELKPKRGRGRPPNPDHERVIDLAMRYVAEGKNPHMAVRLAIDFIDDWRDLSPEGAALDLGPTSLVKPKSALAKDQRRYKTAFAKWEQSDQTDAPPRPESTLDDRDTAVEQIARKLRKRLK